MVDMTHKLTTYILKNPPATAKSSKKEASDIKDPKELKEPKESKKKSEIDNSGDDFGDWDTGSHDDMVNGVNELSIDGEPDVDPLQELYDFVVNHQRSDGDIDSKIDELDIPKHKAALVLTHAFFTENVMQQIPQKAKYLQKVWTFSS